MSSSDPGRTQTILGLGLPASLLVAVTFHTNICLCRFIRLTIVVGIFPSSKNFPFAYTELAPVCAFAAEFYMVVVRSRLFPVLYHSLFTLFAFFLRSTGSVISASTSSINFWCTTTFQEWLVFLFFFTKPTSAPWISIYTPVTLSSEIVRLGVRCLW